MKIPHFSMKQLDTYLKDLEREREWDRQRMRESWFHPWYRRMYF